MIVYKNHKKIFEKFGYEFWVYFYKDIFICNYKYQKVQKIYSRIKKKLIFKLSKTKYILELFIKVLLQKDSSV
jgi:hypothetical protein